MTDDDLKSELIASTEGLSDSDLRNLADFYGIIETRGGFIYRDQMYVVLIDAVRAARSSNS